MNSSVVEFLTYDTLKALAMSSSWNMFSYDNSSVYYHGHVKQLVTIADIEDVKLLRSSVRSFSIFSKELAIVRIHCQCGEVINSKILKGNKRSVSSHKELRNIIMNLVSKTRFRGLKISFIEITHTHLTKQKMIFTIGKLQQVYTQGLSEADASLGWRLSEFIDYPLKLKAVTRDMIVYAQWF